MSILVTPGVTFTRVVTMTSKVLGWSWGVTYNGLLQLIQCLQYAENLIATYKFIKQYNYYYTSLLIGISSMSILVTPGVTFTRVVTMTSKVLGWSWGVTYNGLLQLIQCLQYAENLIATYKFIKQYNYYYTSLLIERLALTIFM